MSWLSVRPPTRSRASTSRTDLPAFAMSRAAAMPAKPAPTTTTSAFFFLVFAAFACALDGSAAAAAPAAVPPIRPRLEIPSLMAPYPKGQGRDWEARPDLPERLGVADGRR